MIVIHLTLAAFTYIDFDAYHKYHDYAGVQGWVLIFLKLIVFFYYVYLVRQVRLSIPKRSEEFHRKFIVLGAVYLLTVPCTIFGSYFFPPYSRQYMFTITTNIV